jgi:putative membrane protein
MMEKKLMMIPLLVGAVFLANAQDTTKRNNTSTQRANQSTKQTNQTNKNQKTTGSKGNTTTTTTGNSGAGQNNTGTNRNTTGSSGSNTNSKTGTNRKGTSGNTGTRTTGNTGTGTTGNNTTGTTGNTGTGNTGTGTTGNTGTGNTGTGTTGNTSTGTTTGNTRSTTTGSTDTSGVGNAGRTGTTGTSGTTGNTNTSTTDHTNMSQGTDASGQMTSTGRYSAMGIQPGSLHRKDLKFVVHDRSSNMQEIESTRLALQYASNSAVKDFANMMVEHHTMAVTEMKSLLAGKGAMIPDTTMMPRHRMQMETLSALQGAAFDKMYMRIMVDAHEEDVDEFEDETTDARDADIRAFTTRMLPALQMHYTKAKDLRKQVK